MTSTSKNPTSSLVFDDRTALVVDGQSLYMLSKRAGVKQDMAKLKDWLSENTSLAMCFYHTALHVRDDGHSPMRRFLDFLRHQSWTVFEKPGRYNPTVVGASDPDQQFDVSHSVAANIAELLLGGRVEQIVVLSNNPKLADMYQLARNRGTRIVVLSSVDLSLFDRSNLTIGDGFIEFAEVMGNFTRPEAVAA